MKYSLEAIEAALRKALLTADEPALLQEAIISFGKGCWFDGYASGTDPSSIEDVQKTAEEGAAARLNVFAPPDTSSPLLDAPAPTHLQPWISTTEITPQVWEGDVSRFSGLIGRRVVWRRPSGASGVVVIAQVERRPGEPSVRLLPAGWAYDYLAPGGTGGFDGHAKTVDMIEGPLPAGWFNQTGGAP